MKGRVTKDELLAAANDRAVRLDCEPVPERTLRLWVEKGLLEKAEPLGVRRAVCPRWYYSLETVEVVKLIVALMSLGARRHAELRICLWIFGYQQEIGEVRKSLQSEWKRRAKRERKKQPWQDDLQAQLKLNDSEHARYHRRLPPLDPTLAASMICLSQDAQREVMSAVNWEMSEVQFARSVLAREITALLGTSTSGAAAGLFSSMLSGILGSPDEIADSGDEILKKVADEDLIDARNIIWLCVTGLFLGYFFFKTFYPESAKSAAYERAVDSFLTPQWAITSLAVFATTAYRLGTSEILKKL